MIQRCNNGKFKLICDFCDETKAEFTDFYDAVDYKKENGWKSVEEFGNWFDKCPDCCQE